MNIHELNQAGINRVAENHYFVTPQLAAKLKESVITSERRVIVGD